MMVYLFLLLSSVLLLSAVSVLISKNPIHSVLFLILVFISSTGVLLLLNVEFLGMIFMIIYIGAISVLFLFVIMMLNIRIIELKENLLKYAPLTLILGFILFFELIYIFYFLLHNDLGTNIELDDLFFFNFTYTNLQLLGYLIYTYFVDYFLICGIILFVAMIGAIMLTLHVDFLNKKQDLYFQINRDFSNTVKNIKILK